MAQILVVDDNSGDLALINEAALSCGMTADLHLARNAVQAYDFLSNGFRLGNPAPSLIILDLGLPIISGKQVLETLRSDARWRSVPIVVLTGSTQLADKTECLKLGAIDYVLKPKGWSGYLSLFRMIRTCIEGGVYRKLMDLP